MRAEARCSLAGPVALAGRGLHTGHHCRVRLLEATAGHGIRFVRTDLPGRPVIPATVAHVAESDRRTVLRADGASVDTVEHLLAAIAGHDLDDVLIEIDGPEPPILDGSAEPYFAAIAAVGTIRVGGAKTRYGTRGPVAVRHGDASYRAIPGGPPRIAVTVHWDHPLIGTQSGRYELCSRVFARELAAARTFGFAAEIGDLRARGLIGGASTDCAVVLGEGGLAAGALRWPDEFVRHKALDLVGDLALLGGRFEGEIIAERPSHAGNVALARRLARETPPGPRATAWTFKTS